MFQVDRTTELPTVQARAADTARQGLKNKRKDPRVGKGASKEGKELTFIKDLHIYHLAYITLLNPLNSPTPILQVRKLRFRI